LIKELSVDERDKCKYKKMKEVGLDEG